MTVTMIRGGGGDEDKPVEACLTRGPFSSKPAAASAASSGVLSTAPLCHSMPKSECDRRREKKDIKDKIEMLTEQMSLLTAQLHSDSDGDKSNESATSGNVSDSWRDVDPFDAATVNSMELESDAGKSSVLGGRLKSESSSRASASKSTTAKPFEFRNRLYATDSCPVKHQMIAKRNEFCRFLTCIKCKQRTQYELKATVEDECDHHLVSGRNPWASWVMCSKCHLQGNYWPKALGENPYPDLPPEAAAIVEMKSEAPKPTGRKKGGSISSSSSRKP